MVALGKSPEEIAEAIGKSVGVLTFFCRQFDISLERSTPKTPQQQRHGPQFDRVVRALRKIFPPDGKAPAGMAVETVRGRVVAQLAEESRQRGLADPSWKVVAAIEFLGRSD